jgi:hypothetical protein
MSHAATATFNYVASKLGVTGFQASCADMDILRHTRHLEWGRVLNFENLLYPQYCDAEHFPGFAELLELHKDELAKRAKALLEKDAVSPTHPNVLAHWKALAANGGNSTVPAATQPE